MTSHMHKNPYILDSKVNVHNPLGEVVVVDKEYRDCVIQMSGAKLYADLIVLPFHEFDIILGINWLSRHHAKNKVVFCGDRQTILSCLVYAMKAFKMIRNGCDAYLAHMINTNATTSKLGDIPVIKEFPDVFLEELSRMPPDRDIEFSIKLLPGTTPISNSPYQTAPLELKDLKK
ncbi:uncharacterized protein LOC141691437 [Apium graveolens]|uniref:uncharacterized protein LOC141691437 n=1 Tax=Apium graveolens TaxID=4045 RepID=UPI003D78DAF5